jgi:hypothetical protein
MFLNKSPYKAAGVAWWSSALTPSREGASSIPNPGTPFPTLGTGCFTPLPGSGWQVLFDSQHGSISSKKSDTLQKMVAGQPEPDPQKKKKKKKESTQTRMNGQKATQTTFSCMHLRAWYIRYIFCLILVIRTVLKLPCNIMPTLQEIA